MLTIELNCFPLPSISKSLANYPVGLRKGLKNAFQILYFVVPFLVKMLARSRK